MTLSGLPIGKGHWTVNITHDRYTATATGGTMGLVRLFAGGDGKSSANGAVIGGTPMPGNFDAVINGNKGKEEFRVVLDGNNVKDFAITPTPAPNPDRVPLTDAHRRGVSDPMTASLIRVAGNGNPISPEACQRKVSVFDARMRYDVQLAYKRMDQISATKGYAGASVVCTVTFVPIAGHNPERMAMKYLANVHDMEVWLAPVAGTRVLVPFRVSVSTPIGPGIMQATEFETSAVPAQATVSSAKSP